MAKSSSQLEAAQAKLEAAQQKLDAEREWLTEQQRALSNDQATLAAWRNDQVCVCCWQGHLQRRAAKESSCVRPCQQAFNVLPGTSSTHCCA